MLLAFTFSFHVYINYLPELAHHLYAITAGCNEQCGVVLLPTGSEEREVLGIGVYENIAS